MSSEVLEAAVNASEPGADGCLVLASGSMARARMLRDAGVPFHQIRPSVDEEAKKFSLHRDGATTEAAAVALAELKAANVAGSIDAATLVLGSDQLLELDDHWLSKPADREAARRQLLALGGRSHRLVAAVSACRGGRPIWHHVESVTVTFRPFSPAFLERYLETVAPETLGSVGGYQAEGPGAQLIERLEGDWFTVMGMPLFPLLAFLRHERLLPS